MLKIAIMILLVACATTLLEPTTSFAHSGIDVDKYHIITGWGIEPPIVGIRNTVVVYVFDTDVTEGEEPKGVPNAFRGVEPNIMFGGTSKPLVFHADEKELGHYSASIIPTKTGTYLLDYKGNLRGVPIDVKAPIEDVEPTSSLNFPPVASSGSGTATTTTIDAEITALKKAVSSMQQDITNIESGQTMIAITNGDDTEPGFAYDIAILGLAIAAAAIIIAIISMIKRR